MSHKSKWIRVLSVSFQPKSELRLDRQMVESDQNKALQEAFHDAENAVKFAERVSGEVALPAINQLRYAMCHLVEEDGERALKHCLRAKYDAYEAAIGYFLDYIASFFLQEFPTDILDRNLPEWRKFRERFLTARTFLCSLRKLRDAEENVFSGIEEELSELIKIRDAIDAAYAEIRTEKTQLVEEERLAMEREAQDREDAKAREDRRRYTISLWWTICGTILGAMGIIIAIFK